MNDTAKIKLQETINKIEGAYAPSTIRAFKADFASYINFCENNNKDAIPTQPSTLASYVEHLTHKKLFSKTIFKKAIIFLDFQQAWCEFVHQ